MSKPQSLEDRISQAGNAVDLLRYGTIGKHVHAGVQAEFSTWMEEQQARRDSAALFDQSHHMTDVYLRGPDALRLLSESPGAAAAGTASESVPRQSGGQTALERRDDLN